MEGAHHIKHLIQQMPPPSVWRTSQPYGGYGPTGIEPCSTEPRVSVVSITLRHHHLHETK